MLIAETVTTGDWHTVQIMEERRGLQVPRYTVVIGSDEGIRSKYRAKQIAGRITDALAEGCTPTEAGLAAGADAKALETADGRLVCRYGWTDGHFGPITK